MANPLVTPESVAKMSDRRWRLNHLYYIVDKGGAVIKFRLNPAQERLLADLSYLNLILKARQLGFSTFILLVALDCAFFNQNFSAGLIADTLDNAKNLLDRVKFAYERIPILIKGTLTVKTDNQSEIEFSNGSSIRVGTSLRSGTYNLLHISEYGKICAKDPGKADEIKTGALNTIAPRQLVFIESTAEGRSGDFYDKAAAAEKLHDAGKPIGDMDYRFHFFPWWLDASYTLAEPVTLDTDDVVYFNGLKAKGIALTDGQRHWYVAKRREQGDGMWKEYPSTPDEAFKSIRDGAYFARDMQNLRILKKIGPLEYVSGIPVHTSWDFGLGDYTAVWLFQVVAGRFRFVGFTEASGEGLAYYFNWIDQWRARRAATFGQHLAPHDVDARRHGSDGSVTTLKNIAKGLGYTFVSVDRNAAKQNSIEAVRSKLPNCEFDEVGCALGIAHLETYSRDWDDRLGVWRSQPRHDEHSHAADAFMTFADGFKDKPAFKDPWKKGQSQAYA